MSANLTPQNWLENTKKSWGLVAEFAVFIFGIVGSFLLPPPGWATAGGDSTLVRLGQFIVAVLAGLIFLVVQKWNRKEHVPRWAILAFVFLIISVLSYFGYQHFLDTRTCNYDEQSVVIGTTLTPQAQEDIKETPNPSCETLLQDFAGKADDVWTRDSINGSRYLLAATYITCLPLFMICIISLVQALSCATQGQAGQPPAPEPQPVAAPEPQAGPGQA